MTAYAPHDSGVWVPEELITTEENTDMDQSTNAMLPDNWRVATLPVSPIGEIPTENAVLDDTDAAADVWPTVGKGKKDVVHHRPDPNGTRAAAMEAVETVRWQDHPALVQAKSAADLHKDMDLARHERDAERELRRREVDAVIAEKDADREHAEELRRLGRDAERNAEKASATRDRILDPTSALVKLDKAMRFIPGAALVPALLAILVGAVNVCLELNRVNPETWLVNWSVELLFTWPLLVILAAQALGAIPKGSTNRYVGIEVLLTVIAIVLNVGLHWVPANHWAGDLVWLFVPAGLGFSAYLVPALTRDIRQGIAEWSADTAGEGVTPPSYRENTATDTAPRKPSQEELVTAELARLVARGEWTKNLSAPAIRDHFRCGMDIARAARDHVKARFETTAIEN